MALPLFLFVFFLDCAAAGEYYFVTLDNPPIEYANESRAAEGAAVQIVKQIMDQIGHTVVIEVLPWTRALKMVDHGQADAIFTIFDNNDGNRFVDYSKEVLVQQVMAFYARKNDPIEFEGTLGTMRNKQIGVVSTISYGNKFDFARPYLNIERTNTLEQNISKLLYGRIDLFVSDIYSAEYSIRKMGLTGRIVRVQPHIETVPSYIAFSKKKNLIELRDAFDRELKKIKNSGEYLQIMHRARIDQPD